MTKRRGNGSGKLKDEHKAFLVQRLAVFDSPKQAAEALMAEFGIELTPQGVEAYDPTKCAGHALRERWRTVFWTVRENFLAELRQVGFQPSDRTLAWMCVGTTGSRVTRCYRHILRHSFP